MRNISNGMRAILALALALTMALGMASGAWAAEAVEGEPDFAAEPEWTAPEEEPAPAPEQAPAPVMPEEPAAPEAPVEPETPAVPEENFEPETAETPAPTEAPIEEPLPAEPQDEPETIQAEGYDPEDPIYSKEASHEAAPASLSTDSFEDFTPRALKPGETLRLGIDVSVYQGGNIDWGQVAASGIEFAFIRVGYRTLKSGELMADTYYARNLAGAKAAGLKVGAYIFSQAISQEEAREEARFLMDRVKGYSIDLPLVFDYEFASGGRLYRGLLSRQEGTDVCNAFCQEVEAQGYESMVYSNPSMLANDIYRDQVGKLWLAHYTKKTTYSGEYEYWQCGAGQIDGISGETDMNFWFDPGGKLTPPSQQQTQTATPKPTATPKSTPAAPPAASNPFGDVSASSWYYADVLAAYQAGVVKGQTDTLFAPGATATRAQVVTMLYRMEGSPAVAAAAAFQDLTQEYYKNAVNWAAANKIVSGTSDTTFSPNSQITREQLAAMLYRLEGSPSVSGSLSKFSDGASVHEYARSAMIWAVQAGVVNGNADGTLRPSASATRAEVCAMLMRFDRL